MKAPRNVALATLATTIMAIVVPPTSATADQGDTLKGGCGFNTEQSQILTNGQNEGLIYVAALSQEAASTPSTATVSCWIDVNGSEEPGTRLTATANGLIVGEQQISFSAIDGDTITECQQVTFADGSTWTAADGNVGVDCPAATIVQPPIIDQVVNLIIQVLITARNLADNVFTNTIDPTACFIFKVIIGPGTYGFGAIQIRSDGDVYLAHAVGTGYDRIYDCPPY